MKGLKEYARAMTMAFTMYSDNGKMAFKSGRTKGPYQKDTKGHWRANV